LQFADGAFGARRLVNTLDLGSLPVVHRTRLFRAPVTHVAFSSCGGYLAAAAASTGRVALLKIGRGGQHVQLLGYAQAEGALDA
jgi:6-phosphogluconolactonase (cycloisomerase 2 family)